MSLIAILFGVGFALSPATVNTANADIFAVDSKGDEPDADGTDNVCDDGNGNCTLRAAIQQANATSGADIITFDGFTSSDLTGGVIEILLQDSNGGQLEITGTTSIFGSTAPETAAGEPPVIIVNGENLPSGSDDVFRFSSGSGSSYLGTVSIIGSPQNGVEIRSSDVTVTDCYIGLKPDGTTVVANEFGVATKGADNNDITNNVITGNSNEGIYINSGGNTVDGNLIGVTADSSSAPGNGSQGIELIGGSGNQIGAGSIGNTISGNGTAGIDLDGGGSQEVRANHIGTTPDGSGEFPNGGDGIIVDGDGTTIVDNVISGNDDNGIDIGVAGDADGTTIDNNIIGLTADESSVLPNGGGTSTGGGIVCGSSSGTTVTEVMNNVISGNAGNGIWITSGCFDWDVNDNYVGTNSNFDGGLGNDFNGINVKSNPSSNVEDFDIEDNIIGSNASSGIDIRGTRHDMENNYIGLAPDGSDLGNAGSGIVLDGTRDHPVDDVNVGIGSDAGDGTLPDGTSTPNGSGNVIGNNGSHGILVLGDANEVHIIQNYVGTTPGGANIGNGDDGIQIDRNNSASTNHEIGYLYGDSITDPDPANGGDGNVVAYNDGDGITVGTSQSTTNVRDVSVRGNVVYQNGTADQTGIDLGNKTGALSNDDGAEDADTGVNNLQNYPRINSVNYDAANNDVTIDYTVFTASANADYGSKGLKVDFYAADSETSGEGKIFLATQLYDSPSTAKQKLINLDNFSNVTKDDHFVATVTDASGNTSEFLSTPELLPVEIASFDANQSGEEAVELTWTTASETNNAGFRVQHQGPDSEEWSKVGFVESRAQGGTTTEATKYRFETSDLAIGSHQFRLKQVDLSGATHIHKAVTVELTMQEPIMLSAPAPNPVRSQANFSFAVREAQSTSITVYNVLGQKVKTLYRGTPTAGEEVDVTLQSTDLASGAYFIRIQAGNHTRTQRMTVVQ